VDRGERVKKGQALMRLDPTDLALGTIKQLATAIV
jgi:multidrug efflux pump subunit AcrA (membrane-fusion protein)